MGRTFPTDREEKRQVLLEGVDRVRHTLRAGADEAEANATLPPATVQALDDAGLLALKLPSHPWGCGSGPGYSTGGAGSGDVY